MDKNAVKSFAIGARIELIDRVKESAKLIGITENGIAEKLDSTNADVFFYDVGLANPVQVPKEENTKRNQLCERIKAKESTSNYITAYEYIMEEVAYTWFNRLIAIRFMEVNDYLPSGFKVLSSSSGQAEPDMYTNYQSLDFLTDAEKSVVNGLKLANKNDEAFQMLFIKQCNELNKILPKLFENTSDCIEVLFNLTYTDTKGVIARLVNDIAEADFQEIEIIGWLYQYYNIDAKAEVYANIKKVKVTTETLPAATQLFTPQWIVKYMVENSVGRIGVDNFGVDPYAMGWKYYLQEADQEESVQAELDKLKTEEITLEEVKIIDPCMGSGHILVYVFDVLVQLYINKGRSGRDIPKLILENNLFGLDIDKRAYQLAYFCVMMKGRQYDRRFFTREVEPQIYCPLIDKDLINYGSLVKVDKLEEKPEEPAEITLETQHFEYEINDWNYKRLLHQKYDAVVTNPPYLGSSNLNANFSGYLKKNYPDSKSDLFAAFIEKCNSMVKENYYSSLVTMHSWMFLSSYEKLRVKLLHSDIINMAHLGARAFEEIGGEVVQTTSWVMRKTDIKYYQAIYHRLVDFNSQDEKEKEFLAKSNLHLASQDNFAKIPGSPIAYWVSDDMLNVFDKGTKLEDIAYSFQGMITGSNEYYLRIWHEVSSYKLKLDMKNTDRNNPKYNNIWIPYNKGGSYRKWFGNNEYLLRWIDEGKKLTRARTENVDYYFKEGVTWSFLSSGNFSCRCFNNGFLWDVAGSSIFTISDISIEYLCALMNCKISQNIVTIQNPM